MHPVFCLIKDYGAGAVNYLAGYFFASMSRQAVHNKRAFLG
jgi:hypothetical protein